jgi:hypothetical protein
MAKKAKRRGRPPGSKNKKQSVLGVGKSLAASVAKMEVGQLRAHIDNLEDMLAAKVTQQRNILQGQLAGLQGYVSAKAAGVVRTVLQVPRTGTRARPNQSTGARSTSDSSGRAVACCPCGCGKKCAARS